MRRSLLACTFSSAARSSVTSGSTGTRRLPERGAAAGGGALELMLDDLRHAVDLELDRRGRSLRIRAALASPTTWRRPRHDSVRRGWRG